MPLKSAPAADLVARLKAFPRVGLGHYPTPLEPLPNLTRHLGGPRLWVKREDCSGVGFGGNKLRKLDFVLTEALARGADTLVSGGVVQSNSQRQVAAAAAKLSLACHLAVYHGRVAPPGPDYESSGNALLNKVFGAVMHAVPWTGDRNAALNDLAARLEAEGRRPYVVPYGVSDTLGAIGYTSALAEIAVQSADLGFTPDAIVHSSGSGATQAGLVVGAQAALPETEIVGIDIDAEPERVRADVIRYASAAAERLGLPFADDKVEVIAGYAGPAYGVPHQATLDALALAGRTEALVLDPVYSAKGLAGLIALIGAGRWRPDQNLVFVHTGGAAALFAYREALESP